MKLHLYAVVDDKEIASAQYARGFTNVRVSPAERGIWKSVDDADRDRLFDRGAEHTLTAWVPDGIWSMMERFADGGSFPRVRFRFLLELRDHGHRGVEIHPESERPGVLAEQAAQ